MLSSSTETTGAETWDSKVAGKWELMSEWDSWGVKGGLDMIVVIVGGPRPLLRALWGRLSNKSRLLLGTVHRCHQQVPCNKTAGAGGSRTGRGRGLSISGQGTSRWTLTLGTGSRNRSRETQRQQWIDGQVPAAVMQRIQESGNQRTEPNRATRKLVGLGGNWMIETTSRTIRDQTWSRLRFQQVRGPKSRGPRDGGRPPPCGSVRLRNKPLLDLAVSFRHRLDPRLGWRKRGPVSRDKPVHTVFKLST